MKNISKIQLGHFHEMDDREMKQTVGGTRITGVRFHEGTCFCDYQYAEGAPRCDIPCEVTICEERGIDTGLKNLQRAELPKDPTH